MRARPIAAVVATVGGLAMLFSFKTPSQQGRVNAAGGGPTTPPTTGATDGSSSTIDPTSTAPPDSSTAAPTSSAASDSSTTSPASTAGSAARTVQGSLIPTRFGDVQVAVVFQGTKIVDVKSVTLPNDRERSAEISFVAAPMLHDEVLQAQSAQIDLLSGATYTSEAYAQSVQGALDSVAKA